jgi:outer membrane protein insertion porin family
VRYRRRAWAVHVAGLLVALGFVSSASGQTLVCRAGGPEVRSLRFTGNRAFSDSELERSIVTTPSAWSRRALHIPLGAKRCLDREELANDRLRLLLLYRTRGFPEAAVEVRSTAAGQGRVDVEFRIAEGPTVILREFTIRGLEGVPARTQITRGLPIRAGDRLDRERLDAARDTILQRLRNSGYPRAQARHALAEDAANRSAVDTLFVVPGQLTQIGAVAVEATPLPGRRQQVPSGIVRRIAGIRPGDVYRESRLLEAQRSLYLTDAYRQVSVRVDTTASPDSLALVTLVVSEDAMRAARIGAGYGTLDCFRGTAELTNYNFLSGARRLELTTRVSKIGVGDPLGGAKQLCPQARDDPYSSRLNYYVGATLRQPVLFGLRTVPSVTVFSARTSEFKAYLRTTNIGGIASIDWRRFRRTPVTLAYQLDYGRTEAQPALFCAVFNRCVREERDRLQSSQRLGTVSLAVTRNTADNPLSPRTGGAWRLELRHASQPTLSDSGLGFSKAVGDIARYWPLGGTVVAVRLRAGGLFSPSFGDVTGFVPPEERLFAGGPTTVRGFPQNELGSAIYLAALFDTVMVGPDTLFRVADSISAYQRAVPVGGNSLVVANVEWRVRSPILSDIFQLTLFTDVGDVWNRGRTDVFRNFRLKTTPGIQIGGVSPVGLVRMVVGYNPYERPRGPIYYEQTALEGGGLPCVSPNNTLRVHSRSTATGTILEQEPGACPGTFIPATPSSFRSRLTFSFAIGQAF